MIKPMEKKRDRSQHEYYWDGYNEALEEAHTHYLSEFVKVLEGLPVTVRNGHKMILKGHIDQALAKLEEGK